MSPAFEDVTRLTAALPGVNLGTSYGTPALRVGRRFMARLWEDGEVLVLKPVEDIEQRFLIETQPGIFFKAPHYDSSNAILVHLSTIDEETLGDLLNQCWRRLASRAQLKAAGVAGPS